MERWTRRALACGLAMGIGLAAAGSATAATTGSVSYTAAGTYAFVVPAGVSSVTITAVGAAGGTTERQTGNVVCDDPATPGEGATVTASVPVTSGEQLTASVGGVGGTGTCAGGGVPAGGFNGGGDSGSAQGQSGGGGGGMSSVSLGGPFSNGVLVIAAGGGGVGGGGGIGGSNGGNADSDGSAGTFGGNGGGSAGTQSAGGAGGSAGSDCSDAVNGADGSFGVGGAGATSSDAGSGGGGGGGYFGGGGGSGSGLYGGVGCSGGGGGGGASYVTGQAMVLSAPAPSSSAASITITYDAPAVNESTDAITFSGTEPLGEASAEQDIVLTNDGSAPLIVSGVHSDGTDPGDFLIDNRCDGQTAPGSTCTIGVRFSPAATGARSATLSLDTNAATAPAAITLTGTGGTLPTGATGEQGATGKTGPRGARGARGPRGKSGKIELVTCNRKGHCKAKLVSGTVRFKTAEAGARATVSRGGITYATGRLVRDGRAWRLALRARRRIVTGTYTLTLRGRGFTERLAIALRS